MGINTGQFCSWGPSLEANYYNKTFFLTNHSFFENLKTIDYLLRIMHANIVICMHVYTILVKFHRIFSHGLSCLSIPGLTHKV